MPDRWRAPLRGYDPWATAGDCTFDVEAARRAVEFFPDMLTFTEGARAGEPFQLEPWQEWIVAHTFGWKRPNGLRRYRQVFLYVPRGNGKTVFAAGILIYVGMCDGEAGAQLYSAAADHKQASITLELVKKMLRGSRSLIKRARIFTHHVVFHGCDGVFRSLTADAETKHGLNMHFGVIDELHAHSSRKLYDVLWTSTRKRRNPLCFITTTADYDRPSICNETLKYAQGVRDGLIEDRAFLPAIWETSRDANWKSPQTWRDANPNMGVTITEEDFAAEVKKAEVSPEYENTLKRLGLNMPTGTDHRWLSVDEWDQCGADFTLEDLEGLDAWIGVDLSTINDLSSVALVVPHDGKLALWQKIYAPAGKANERELQDRVPYATWGRQGHVIITKQPTIDYNVIEADIKSLCSRLSVRAIGVDPCNANQMLNNLLDSGLPVINVPQGPMLMSPPSKEFERLMLNRGIKHNRNPVMRWMIGNVGADTDNAHGNIRPMKNRSADKIDGVVATIIALGRWMEDGSPGGSVYDTTGVLVL